MRRNYWSCTKFADWLRGTPKLKAGTSEEWRAWTKAAKTKKWRYWLAEEGLDCLQNFVCWPVDLINSIRYHLDNRWIVKTHALTSNLKRGQWYDFDTRMLHALFDELVNFVEIDQAWRHVLSADEKRNSGRYGKRFHLERWRSPEAGLAHLEWAANLKHDEEWVDKDDPDFGKPTAQALAAQEITLIYKWWKEERPKRPDPMDASGWSSYCEEHRQIAEEAGDESFWPNLSSDDSNRNRSHEILEICHRIEKEQEDEDTAMLIRLVKIRNHLWT